MRRMPILYRITPLTEEPWGSSVLCGIRPDFSGLSPCKGQVAYVLLTRAPVASGGGQVLLPAAPRLACVKPVASVHPEPGSNSSLLLILFFFFSKSNKASNVELLPFARLIVRAPRLFGRAWPAKIIAVVLFQN